ATENIGQAFPTSKFALNGYLLSERTPLLPKTNGAEPISASSSTIRRPAITSGYELWWYGISKERDCGEKQSFLTWGTFCKEFARGLAFRAIDEEQSGAIKPPDRSTFSSTVHFLAVRHILTRRDGAHVHHLMFSSAKAKSRPRPRFIA